MTVDPLERLRRENPVPDMPPAPPIEPLLRRLREQSAAGHSVPGRGIERIGVRRLGVGRVIAGLLVAAVVGITLAIGAGGLILLRGHNRSTPSVPIPTGTAAGRKELIDVIGVLRRPQSTVDLDQKALSLLSGPGLVMLKGTPERALARFATVAPWGERLYLVPVRPLTAQQLGNLTRRFHIPPGAASRLRARRETLSVVGSQGGNISGGTAGDINAGSYQQREGGGPGASTTTRVFVVVPDGVSTVRFVLPRNPFPGAAGGPIYPHSLGVTVPVHNNVATMQAKRVAGSGNLPTIWYAADGRVIKRIGNLTASDRVIAPPTAGPQTALSRAAERDPSTPNPVSVTPATGQPHTTFSAHFRVLLNGAEYRYTLSGTRCPGRFRGGFEGGVRGRIWTQKLAYPNQAWCPGTYHLSVAVISFGPAGNLTHPARPFGTATFTARP